MCVEPFQHGDLRTCVVYIIGDGDDLLEHLLASVLCVEPFRHGGDRLASVLCVEPFRHGGDLL